VKAFSIDPNTGTLTAVGTVRSRQEPAAIAVLKGTQPVTYSPTFAYVANQASSALSGFSVDPANGQLAATAPSSS
jgi:6-phosphogluconolactonase (cycloisomerase 2 family)